MAKSRDPLIEQAPKQRRGRPYYKGHVREQALHLCRRGAGSIYAGTAPLGRRAFVGSFRGVTHLGPSEIIGSGGKVMPLC